MVQLNASPRRVPGRIASPTGTRALFSGASVPAYLLTPSRAVRERSTCSKHLRLMSDPEPRELGPDTDRSSVAALFRDRRLFSPSPPFFLSIPFFLFKYQISIFPTVARVTAATFDFCFAPLFFCGPVLLEPHFAGQGELPTPDAGGGFLFTPCAVCGVQGTPPFNCSEASNSAVRYWRVVGSRLTLCEARPKTSQRVRRCFTLATREV